MAGLYIHIPFCRKACYYCNFHFSTSKKLRQVYVDALIKEISIKKRKIALGHSDAGFDKGIQSVYFGGGTPSQLAPGELARITDALRDNFEWDENIEFTLEANPDDITLNILKAWQDMGVNRLSIGIQSFREKDLKYLGRQHDTVQAEYAIKSAQDIGFDNINIDLIYGIPTQTDKDWEDNLNIFNRLNIPHLSAYCLTVEPQTPLHVLIRKAEKENVSEAQAIAHFEMLIKFAEENGLTHYEISNFCRGNTFSKHNLSYWQQKPYLGFGAAAHSCYDDIRTWNMAHTAAYIKNITEGKPFCEAEQLDLKTKYNEYILTSLRTLWGCDCTYVMNNFGTLYYNYLTKQTLGYIDRGLLRKENTFLFLTDKGKLLADGITADLFMVD